MAERRKRCRHERRRQLEHGEWCRDCGALGVFVYKREGQWKQWLVKIGTRWHYPRGQEGA